MSRRAHLIFGVCLALLTQTCNLPAQQITVRVIDVHSGRPIARYPLDIRSQGALGAGPPLWFYGRTGADGIVKVSLPQPPPSKITVMQKTDWMRYPPCACSICDSVDMQRLMTHGIVAPPTECACNLGKQASKITSTPGELVIFALPEAWWEKLRDHLSDTLMLE